MSASNSPLRPAPAQPPLLLRGANALANSVSRLVDCIHSEIVDTLANYHLSHHSHRFVMTERDTFQVERGSGDGRIGGATRT